ncbi:MAG TPA: FtsX-like permease family protein [Vicinamibacterales bacterium]|nr:FtsX-like permease family protein [Vicinamibacterales bacterium]
MSGQPPSAWLALARWLIAPSQREEAEGDLIELWARLTERGDRAPSFRFWQETLSLAIASRRRLEEDFAQDVRHGLRLVRRLPGLALAACTSLAIGVGGTTAAFTMIDAALLRPWPYPDADRLMVVSTNLGRYFSPPAFRRIADQHDGLDHLTAVQAHGFLMNFGGQAVLVNGHRVSSEVVALLGLNGPLPPEAGRTFIPSEFTPAGEPAVAISHRLWRSRYASSDAVIGQTIIADGTPLRVVGVLSRNFDFFPDSDLLVPLTFSEPGAYSEYDRTLEVYGSLRPGLTPDLAALMLTGRTRYFLPRQVASVESVRERVFRGFRPTVKILSVVSLIILVVGCLNFATLLTIRSADRRQELAVRIAMGAGRHRIVRQLVTEALVLSVVGGAAGLLLAYIGREVLAGNATEGMLELSRSLEWRVIAFATVLAVSTGVLFSVGPARRATAQLDLESSLRNMVSSPLAGISSFAFRGNWLVGSIQVAFTMVLLVGAALLVKSLLRIQSFDPGYDSNHTVTLRFDLPRTRYRTDADVAGFVERLTDRIRAIPGVQDAGAASSLPFSVGALRMRHVVLEGPIRVSGPQEAMPFGWQVPRPPPPPPGMTDMPPIDFVLALSCEVDPGFFRTMRIPVIKGRDFTPFDTATSLPVILINQAMADRYWPDADPIGRRMRLGPLFPWKTIVGVVGNIRRFARDDEIRSEYYEPFAQAGDQRRLLARLGTDLASRGSIEAPSSPAMVVVRSPLGVRAVANATAPLVRAIDAALPIARVSSLREALDNAIADRRFILSHVVGFAMLALFLAAVGVYAVTSHVVRRRGHELGIRAALGARGAHLVCLAMREGVMVAVVGVVAGGLLSIALTPQLRGFLYDVNPWDWRTLCFVALLLAPAVICASYFPARRAARVDPLTALKSV